MPEALHDFMDGCTSGHDSTVPIYDFRCASCGHEFEELVSAGDLPACPRCGAPEPDRLLSQVAPPARIGLRGAAARRSDATRRAREEHRREERAAGRRRTGPE
jgi:putative FmdB family regulatory protein